MSPQTASRCTHQAWLNYLWDRPRQIFQHGAFSIKTLANEDTLLRTHCCPWCFLGCANWETFVADTKCFWTKSETFFVSRTQNLCPHQMLRPRENGETFVSEQCVRNNLSSFGRAFIFTCFFAWNINAEVAKLKVLDTMQETNHLGSVNLVVRLLLAKLLQSSPDYPYFKFKNASQRTYDSSFIWTYSSEETDASVVFI